MKILYNTGSEFKESKESAENLSVKIIDDNGDTVEKTVQELVSDNFYGLERLIGTEDINDDHRSVREIARNELAKQLIPEDAKESLDTLHEIADWIQDHPDDASQMNSRINTLEEAVPFLLYIQNGVYGYKKENGDFVPFKSQADIDAAVTAAKVGTATAADVLAGKTFTNSSESGITGTMPSRSNGEAAVSTDRANGIRVFFPRGHYPNYASHDGQSYVTLTDDQVVNFANKQEKTVTAGTSAASVTPDSGKLLSKVTYNPTPSQSKSCTPSTSAQTISPDSGKLLSSVSVAAIPTQRGASGQAAGNKCWTYNNRVYFGIDYGWYPSGSSFGSMSNVCERYVDYANVASAVGLTAGKLLSGQSCLGISGTGHDSLSGNAAVTNVLSGKTFYSNSVTKQTGTMTDRSNSIQTAATSGTAGAYCLYRNRTTGTSNNRATGFNLDIIPSYGYYGSWDWNKEYITLNSTNISKFHGSTYTYASGSTGGTVDLGATHSYGYVNATNVYNKGKSDGYNQIPTNNGWVVHNSSVASGTEKSINVNNGYYYVLTLNYTRTTGSGTISWTYSGMDYKHSSVVWGPGSKEVIHTILVKATAATIKFKVTDGSGTVKYGMIQV